MSVLCKQVCCLLTSCLCALILIQGCDSLKRHLAQMLDLVWHGILIHLDIRLNKPIFLLRCVPASATLHLVFHVTIIFEEVFYIVSCDLFLVRWDLMVFSLLAMTMMIVRRGWLTRPWRWYGVLARVLDQTLTSSQGFCTMVMVHLLGSVSMPGVETTRYR